MIRTLAAITVLLFANTGLSFDLLYVEADGKPVYSGFDPKVEGVSVIGRVVDQDGKPMGGVMLTPFRNPGDKPNDSQTTRCAAVSSDDDGKFVLESLPPGRYLLKTRYQFHRPPAIEFELATESKQIADVQISKYDDYPIDTRVARWSTYRARAVDPLGNPLRSTSITINLKHNYAVPVVSRRVTTKQDGTFTLYPFDASRRSKASISLPIYRRSVTQDTSDTEFQVRRHPKTYGKVKQDELTCTLSSQKLRCRVKEYINLQVEIKNESDDSILLLQSLDGSGYRWRYPFCYLELNGKPRQLGPRCGNMNGVHDEKFHDVPSKGTFDPLLPGSLNTCSQIQFDKPGTYKLRFVYDASATDTRKWLGILGAGETPADDERNAYTEKITAPWHDYIAAASGFRLVSNKIKIEVTK